MKYLLSYPRSGSTFVRYCLEYVTAKTTVGCDNDDAILTYNEKLPLAKKHYVSTENNFSLNLHEEIYKSDILILLRDFKKAVFSNLIRCNNSDYQAELKKYCNNINTFYNTHNVIYFEDFILNPKLVLTKILNYYNFEYSSARLDDLIENLDRHKNYCKTFYISKHGENNYTLSISSINEWNQIVLEALGDNSHIIKRYI